MSVNKMPSLTQRCSLPKLLAALGGTLLGLTLHLLRRWLSTDHARPILRDEAWVHAHGSKAHPPPGGIPALVAAAPAASSATGAAPADDSSPMARERARAHLKFGNMCARSGNLEKALAHYASASSLDPTFAAPHYNRGGVCQRLKRFAEAVDHYETALRVKPGSVEAASNVVRARGHAFFLEADS